MTVDRHTWTLSRPGVELAIDESGTGETVVLVHGTGTDASVWDDVRDRLPDSLRVVAYDRRGYGLSSHAPVRDYRLHVDDLRQLLASVGPAHVVGWSSGGNTALAAAVDPKTQELMVSLTLLEPPFHLGRVPTPAVLTALVSATIHRWRGHPDLAAESFFRWVSTRTDGPSGWDRLGDEQRASFVRYSRQIHAELLPHRHGVLCDFVSTRSLQSLRSLRPRWIVGDRSPSWYRTVRRRAARHLDSLQAVDLPNTSHFALLEDPSAVAAEIVTSIASAPDGP